MSRSRKKRKERAKAAAAAVAAESTAPVPEPIEPEEVGVAPEDIDVEDDDEDDDEGVVHAAPGADDVKRTRPVAEPHELKGVIESLLFASNKPITIKQIKSLTRIKDLELIEITLRELADDYADRGIVVHEVAGGFQFRTHPSHSDFVQQLVAGRPVRLTRAQLETLAICAYRQPITRPEIDDIRGVDSGGTLRVLLERGLVRVLGKKEEPGRPLLYGTTKSFLEFFNLNDLRDLPTLREYHELTEDSMRVVEQMGMNLSDLKGTGAPVSDEVLDEMDAAIAGADEEDADEVRAADGDQDADDDAGADDDDDADGDADEDADDADEDDADEDVDADDEQGADDEHDADEHPNQDQVDLAAVDDESVEAQAVAE